MNLNLHSSVSILGDESEGFTIIPCDKVYYGHYVYKIKFDISSYYDERTDSKLCAYRNFISEFQDFQYSSLESKCITRLNKSNLLSIDCYIHSFEDYKKIIIVFRSIIKSVFGPVSGSHLIDLKANDYRIEVRKNIWYNKYDAKVFGFLPYRNFINYSKEHKAEKQLSLLEDIKQNIPEESLRLCSYTSASSNSIELYTKIDDFNQYFPFMKLMYADWRFIITKCLLY